MQKIDSNNYSRDLKRLELRTKIRSKINSLEVFGTTDQIFSQKYYKLRNVAHRRNERFE